FLGEDPDEVVEADESTAAAVEGVDRGLDRGVDEADGQQDDRRPEEAEQLEEVAGALPRTVVDDEEHAAEDGGNGRGPRHGAEQQEGDGGCEHAHGETDDRVTPAGTGRDL